MKSAELQTTLAELVSINSINPLLPGGVPDAEGRVCAWLAVFCRKHGLEFETMEVEPGRPNLLARVPGRDERRALLFEAHTDVVAVTGYRGEPFKPFVRDGRLYGRGACDTKASLTAMLHALLALKQQPPPLSVFLLATMSEEVRATGIWHFVNHWLPRLRERVTLAGAVVGEPTGLQIVRAHKGNLRWRIFTRGRAAHSSKPHLGVNAIRKMAAVIRAIEERILPRMAQRSHPLLGPPTLNIGVIRGGVQVNFVPDECWIELDLRFLPGDTKESLLADFETVFNDLRRADPELAVENEEARFDPPLETPETAAVVQAAARACDRVLGRHAVAAAPYGTDASKLSLNGVPTIVFGPGSVDQAHTVEEWVELRQVEAAVRLLTGLALDMR
jgi:acetylornithine deacetylase